MNNDSEEELGEYHNRVSSDVTVYDTLEALNGRARQLVFVTPNVVMLHGGGLDRGVNHDEEAKKIFNFLQQHISCKIYDRLYKLMADSEDRNFHSGRSEFACVVDVRDDDGSIHELERTILVLESVKKSYVEGACAGCMPHAVQTMVDNEILLLRSKVDLLADGHDEDLDGEL